MRHLLLLFALAAGGLVACRVVLGIEQRPTIGDEAGAGADDAGDAPAASGYCDALSPPAQFCADFDVGSLEKGWENEGRVPDPGLFGVGTITEDTTEVPPGFTSPPRSAVFDSPALVTNKSNSAAFLLTHAGTAAPSAFRLDFALRIDTEQFPRGGGGNVLLASIHFPPAGTIVVMRDALGTALSVLDDSGGLDTTVPVTEAVPVGQWKTVTLHVAVQPTDGGSQGWVDIAVGNIAAGGPIALPSAFSHVTEAPLVSVGMPYAAGPMEEFRVNFDDVRMYWY